MKKLRTLSFLSALTLSALLMAPVASRAQFTNGSVFLGPELGLGLGYGGGIVIGGMIESPITNPGTVGSGRLAIAGRLDYWSWSDGFYSYSYIPLAAYCDYHFALNDPRWDLFAGIGLGYVIVNASYSGDLSANYGYNSGVFLAAQAGMRYFFSPNIDFRAELGIGYMPLGVGVDFRL
jgi:hypothetical protein